MSKYLPWGIVIGSLVGLFAGIFWFEMGLALLAGTASGIIISAFLAALKPGKQSS